MRTAEVDARKLDQRVRLERKTEAPDSTGDLVATWATLLDQVHAAVDGPPRMAVRAEASIGDRLTSPGFAAFYIRTDVVQRTGLTPLDRIVWKNRVYDIRDIPPAQPRERVVEIITQTGVNNG